jgi:site-specific DNA-methyltransferase (adenine-specific)
MNTPTTAPSTADRPLIQELSSGLAVMSPPVNRQDDNEIVEQSVAPDQLVDQIVCGGAMDLYSQIESNSIPLIITSPAYYGCRQYGGGRNELGREWHPMSYVENLIQHTLEWKRILAADGNLYLNLGDVYFGTKGFSRNTGLHKRKTDHHYEKHDKVRSEGCYTQYKQLLQLPSQVSIRMASLGWILRNEITWTKPNANPSFSPDRRLPVHEKIFHFVKSDTNFFDFQTAKRLYSHRDHTMHGPEPFKKHQASFPETLVAPYVLTSSRIGDIVFDPFMGSGTVAVVAKRCKRHWIGFELVKENCQDARERVENTKVEPYSDEEIIQKNGIRNCQEAARRSRKRQRLARNAAMDSTKPNQSSCRQY